MQSWVTSCRGLTLHYRITSHAKWGRRCWGQGWGNPTIVALSPSHAQRAHTLCVFSDWFNGVETVAASGMPSNTAMTFLDERDYKLWERTDRSWADPAVRIADQQTPHGHTLERGGGAIWCWPLNLYANADKVYDVYKDLMAKSSLTNLRWKHNNGMEGKHQNSLLCISIFKLKSKFLNKLEVIASVGKKAKKLSLTKLCTWLCRLTSFWRTQELQNYNFKHIITEIKTLWLKMI